MQIARFRHSAEAAMAVLLISGAGIAFAGNSSPAAPVAVAPAVAPAVPPTTEPVEPAGVDTDSLQQGDQTTPDVAPAAVTIAAPAAAKAAASTMKTVTKSAVTAETTTETSTETSTEATGTEEPGDANLPGGGHADNPSDPNADHQFDGVE
jgi:hypothetical protein